MVRRTLTLFVFLTTTFFATAFAQTSVDKARETVNAIGTGPKAKVEAKLKNKTKVKGAVQAITADSFTVIDEKTGSSQTVAFADIDSVKKPRTGLKPRTWIIIGAAAAAAVIVGTTVLYPVLCDGGAGC